MSAAPHYTVLPNGTRWAVVHPVHGLDNTFSVDVDCPTEASATAEATRMNAARHRRLMTERQDVALQGAW
jgi:hypothetical protein